MLAYHRDKAAELRGNCVLALENADPNGVHDMRVAIKRLRAYYRMVEAVNPEFDARKRSKFLKAIAKYTAGIRDAQVQIDLLTDISGKTGFDTEAFRDWLDSRERAAIASFDDYTAARDPLRILSRREMQVKNALDAVSTVRAETLVEGRFRNLMNHLVIASRGDLTDAVLHNIRKSAKETHYACEILTGTFGPLPEGDAFIAALKPVHSALGLWHDCVVNLAYLAAFAVDSGINPATDPWASLRREAARRKGALRRSFRHRLNAFVAVAERV